VIPFVVRLFAEPVRLHIRGQLYRLIPAFDAMCLHQVMCCHLESARMRIRCNGSVWVVARDTRGGDLEDCV